MKRGAERKLLIAGSIWNMFTALITIFGYSIWFKKTGVKGLEETTLDHVFATTTVIDHVTKLIVMFGLLIFVGAIINFIISRKMRDGEIQPKILIWIACWGVFLLFTMDIIGFVLYLIAFVLYLAKNKAIKLSEREQKRKRLFSGVQI
ncbi:hypothetical protein J8TS2_03700 [Lederbergia ruris]|uniref:DUF4064 domain-containing protein n=1 Tax=Lederbergia ruris TaxID=217495 RepID=A0ABQ4KEZ6_9BACI|nr:hypothetical protein [Lederbergia ruris]GIN56051.1 hypothetical protein J8TS2_03700 [Lederbergia ruris]